MRITESKGRPVKPNLIEDQRGPIDQYRDISLSLIRDIRIGRWTIPRQCSLLAQTWMNFIHLFFFFSSFFSSSYFQVHYNVGVIRTGRWYEKYNISHSSGLIMWQISDLLLSDLVGGSH